MFPVTLRRSGVRVAHFHNRPIGGGSERSMIELVAGLRREGIDAVIFLTDEGEVASWAREAGIPVCVLPIGGPLVRHTAPLRRWSWLRGLVRTYGAIYLLRSQLSTDRVALLHTHTIRGHILGALAVAGTRRALVWHFRDRPQGWGRRVLPVVTSFCDAAIALSQPLLDELPQSVRQKTVVVGNLLSFQSPRAYVGPVDPPVEISGNPAVLVPGTLEYWKGQDVFVEAAALTHHLLPEAEFWLVGGAWGDPAYIRRLRRSVERLSLESRVHFLGKRSDLPQLLRQCSFVVCPSSFEPFGRLVFEAAAAGKPVIVGPGGAAQLLADAGGAVLVRPVSAKGIASAMVQLWSEPAKLAEMAERAHKWAQDYGSDERNAMRLAQVVEIYRRLTCG